MHEGQGRVAVVCLYGLYDEGLRSEVELRGLRQYLTGVAYQVVRRQIGRVILCGGYTNEKRPDISEAASVLLLFREYLEGFRRGASDWVGITLEEESVNTPQNLGNAFELLAHADSVDGVLIFTDRYRALKARVIAKRICPYRYEVCGMDREDIRPPWLEYPRQRLAAAAYLLCPPLLRKHLEA